ncbi:MAG TPA: hypothetical protein VFQ70_04185 [Candidatus Saccharimonadaceae bacterium]|nr:hypothetical protein [Candidatus Saccharimonadaceae bacterium]
MEPILTLLVILIVMLAIVIIVFLTAIAILLIRVNKIMKNISAIVDSVADISSWFSPVKVIGELVKLFRK